MQERFRTKEPSETLLGSWCEVPSRGAGTAVAHGKRLGGEPRQGWLPPLPLRARLGCDSWRSSTCL